MGAQINANLPCCLSWHQLYSGILTPAAVNQEVKNHNAEFILQILQMLQISLSNIIEGSLISIRMLGSKFFIGDVFSIYRISQSDDACTIILQKQRNKQPGSPAGQRLQGILSSKTPCDPKWTLLLDLTRRLADPSIEGTFQYTHEDRGCTKPQGKVV